MKIFNVLRHSVFAGLVMLGLGGCIAEDDAPKSYIDMICPEGYSAPRDTDTVDYFCLWTIPAVDYYDQNCPGDTFFCPKLEQDLNITSSSSSSCPSGTEPTFGGTTCGNDDTCIFAPNTPGSPDYTPTIEERFADKPCGVDYDAMGNGSWQACLTLEDGTAGCLHKENRTTFVPLKWSDGSPVTNAAQVSGAGYYDVILVTTEGQLYYGNRTSLNKNAPLFSEGGISGTGGQNTRCAMIEDEGRKDVRCWKDNSDPYRPELPLDFNAMQLTANYSDVCALDDDGSVWCWQQKGDNSLDFADANPTKAPFSEPMVFVSVGQLAVCGVKLSGGIECLARWDSAGFLPSKGSDTSTPVNQTGMEDAIGFQAGFGQGISIHADGSAKLWKGGNATSFAGIANAIAAGGDRDVACALTQDGEVYCLDNSNQLIKITNNIKAKGGACPL